MSVLLENSDIIMAQLSSRLSTTKAVSSLDTSLPSLSFSSPTSPGLPETEGGQETRTMQLESELYQLLKIAVSRGPVVLEIPETVVVSETGRDVLFFNDDKSLIKLYDSPCVLNQFFTQCSRHQSLYHSDTPLYYFTSELSGPKVIYTSHDAELAWNSSRDPFRQLQRYVVGSGEMDSKVRMVWRRKEQIQRLMMWKKGTQAEDSVRRLPRSRSYNALKSPYKYDLNAFRHAGQLKKSSFSPYLPFRSVLPSDFRPKLSLSNSSYLPPKHSSFTYQSEPITQNLPQADRMSDALITVLTRFCIGELEEIEELVYDVVREADGNWCLVKAKWAKIGRKENAKKTSKNEALSEESQEKVREKGLKRKFVELMRTENSSLRVPFIDPREIKEENERVYVSHHVQNWAESSPKEEARTDPVISQLKCSLDQAESKLDDLVSAGNRYRAKMKEAENISLEKYSGEMLAQVLNKVYERMRSDSILSHHFGGRSRAEINMIKTGFMKAFSGVDNVYFKRNVKRAHEGMGISSTAFANFIEIFLAVMREEGIQASDIEIVHRHLKTFTEDVIEDEDEVPPR